MAEERYGACWQERSSAVAIYPQGQAFCAESRRYVERRAPCPLAGARVRRRQLAGRGAPDALDAAAAPMKSAAKASPTKAINNVYSIRS